MHKIPQYRTESFEEDVVDEEQRKAKWLRSESVKSNFEFFDRNFDCATSGSSVYDVIDCAT